MQVPTFLKDRVLEQHRVLTLALGLLLGLSPTIAAHAQTESINQLFAFTCFGGSNNDKCPQGARPDAIIQASDGNIYGAAEVTDDGDIRTVRPGVVADHRGGLKGRRAAGHGHRDGERECGQPQRGQRYRGCGVGPAALVPDRRALGSLDPCPGSARQCDDLLVLRAELRLAHGMSLL